ncbi:MAG: hypothetical protein ACO3GO_07680, partial [Terrimicrobiaceae bacterium]
MRAACLLLLAATSLLAQDQIEVRRALPANAVDLQDYPNPAWMQNLPPQIRRAEPVHPVSGPPAVATP